MWFAHPRYRTVRDGLIAALSNPSYRFRRLEPVVFLCGGVNSSARNTLRKYLAKNNPDLGVFYAEKAWEAIAKHSITDALQMENYLASLADLIVIIVESPGTFAELGAFSTTGLLRQKLLPIIHSDYEQEKHSFLATGPIRWIEQDSIFAPPLYVKHELILECIPEFEERLKRIPRKSTHITDLKDAGKLLLFFVCDLISIIYPASLNTICLYLKEIAPTLEMEDADLHLLLALALALNLIRIFESAQEPVYYPAQREALNRPYHHVPRFNFAFHRAEHVSVLQTIPEAEALLREIGKL